MALHPPADAGASVRQPDVAPDAGGREAAWRSRAGFSAITMSRAAIKDMETASNREAVFAERSPIVIAVDESRTA